MSDFFWFSDAQWARIGAAFADGYARHGARWRSPGVERDRPCPEEWRALGRLSA